MNNISKRRVGNGLIKIMNACIASDREDRYDSVKKLEDDLIGYYNWVQKRNMRYCGVLKKKVRRILFEKLTVGIAATHKGAGATYLSMMLGCYFSQILNKRTIVVEKGKNKVGDNITKGTFEVSNEDSPYCDFTKYQVIIRDYGELDLKRTSEYIKSDIKFVVTNMCEWKLPYFIEFIDRYKDVSDSDKWNYIIPEASDKMLNSIKKYYGVNVRTIGYSTDYSKISEATKEMILNILEEWSEG